MLLVDEDGRRLNARLLRLFGLRRDVRERMRWELRHVCPHSTIFDLTLGARKHKRNRGANPWQPNNRSPF